MSEKIKAFGLWFMFTISLFYAYTSLTYSSDTSNDGYLLKVYHHHIDKSLSNSHLELGTVILYFSQKIVPTILSKKDLPEGKKEYVFVFKNLIVPDAQVQEMIDHVNKKTSLFYDVKIEEAPKPSQGLIFKLYYDSNKVDFSYDTLFSINAHPGLIFRFINKKLEKKITENVHSERITQIASLLPKKKLIMLDIGHGGIDTGAQGVNGVYEKDICLAVGNKVADYLKQSGNAVTLTRTSDKNVALDDRTYKANSQQIDIFVSIHANAALNKEAHGIETFYPSASGTSVVFSTLSNADTLFLKKNYYEQKEQASKKLALLVNTTVYDAIKKDHIQAKNRGIKPASINVLMGCQMPCILVEIGFLSHQNESLLLASFSYQNTIAYAIAQGIEKYIMSHKS